MTELIELELYVKGCKAPLGPRLFFDRDSGGLSTAPACAERGENRTEALPRLIDHWLEKNTCGWYQE